MAFEIPLSIAEQQEVLNDCREMVNIAEVLIQIVGQVNNPSSLIMKLPSIMARIKEDPQISSFISNNRPAEIKAKYGNRI